MTRGLPSASLADSRRATVVDAELRERSTRLESDFLAIVELVIEARDGQYYTRFGFVDLAPYLEARLGLSARSVLRRVGAVEALLTLPAGVQQQARAAMAAVGATKAAILTPAIRRDPAGALDWLQHAAAEPAERLQERVSRALGLKPRGVPPAEDLVLRFLLNQCPPEARDELAAVLALGKVIAGTDSTMAVVLNMARECRVEWDHRAATSARAGRSGAA